MMTPDLLFDRHAQRGLGGRETFRGQARASGAPCEACGAIPEGSASSRRPRSASVMEMAWSSMASSTASSGSCECSSMVASSSRLSLPRPIGEDSLVAMRPMRVRRFSIVIAAAGE